MGLGFLRLTSRGFCGTRSLTGRPCSFILRPEVFYMKVISQVSSDRHWDKFWRRFTSYDFAAKAWIAPLVMAELSLAVHNFVLCFDKLNGAFRLSGLLSPGPDDNYYVGVDGKWLGGYVPAYFRSYPFSLAETDETRKKALCVDESSGLIADTQGEPFFDREGRMSRALSDVSNFLMQVERSRAVTDSAVSAIKDMGLLAEWDVKVRVMEEEISVAGIYRIADSAFNNLDDEAFLRLRKAQALPVVYAQLFSMSNISHFDRLARIRNQEPAESREDDIAQLLEQDGLIRFD